MKLTKFIPVKDKEQSPQNLISKGFNSLGETRRYKLLIKTDPGTIINKCHVALFEDGVLCQIDDMKIILFAFYVDLVQGQGIISPEDRAMCDRIIATLNISPETVDFVKFGVYRKCLDCIVADDDFSEADEKAMKNIDNSLKMTDSQKIAARLSLLIDKADAALQDKKITEIEKEMIDKLKSQLGITESQFGKKYEEVMKWYRMNLIDEGKLPVIEQNEVVLNKREICHYIAPAVFYEERIVKHRVGGASALFGGMSFKVGKGKYVRLGGIVPTTYKTQEMKAADRGVLAITSNRVIFKGNVKGFSFLVGKIIGFNIYSDGIAFQRDGCSKHQVFIMENPEIVGKMLRLVIKNG